MKLVTIGTSQITEEFVRGALASGLYEYAAAYSRDLGRAEEFAAKNGAGGFCGDFEEVARESDVVYVASPNGLHFEQCMYFLGRKKAVICEKPMITKTGQYDKLFEAARENGTYFFEAFRHINTPAFGRIRESMEKIGPVRNAIFTYNQYSSRYDAFKKGAEPNIFNPALDGGALYDLGIYPVSAAAALWGAPLDFVYKSVALRNGADGAGGIVLEYPGFICNVTYGKTAPEYLQSEITGENGGIVIDKIGSPEKMSLMLKDGGALDISVPGGGEMIHEAKVFHDIIKNKNDEEFLRLAEISRKTSEIVLKIYGK